MGTLKKVLLVFIPTRSGVDGARSIYAEREQSLPARMLARPLRTLIRKSPFSIPPLSLMILASIRVEGVEQTICDLRLELFPDHVEWDLIGISVQTGTASEAFELADRLRSQGTLVALGGPHVTMFPEASARHADLIVEGEADDLWRRVLTDLRQGTLGKTYRQEERPDLSLPRPVFKEHLDAGRYFTTNLIQTSRGCPHNCDFCNVHVLNGHRLRQRPIEEIVGEVARFREHDGRIFFFVDDSINADPDYAEELFRRLTTLRITWFGQATTALGMQQSLLETFARSGCSALLVGIESVEPASRKAHHKNQSRSDELVQSVRNIRSAGISLYGSFIYGLDGDTLETPAAILDFINQTELDVPGINILRPTPGTQLFLRLREEGRLLFDPDDPAAFRYTFGQEMLYRPKQIPLDRFIESYGELTSRIFTVPASLKRAISAPSAKTAVGIFNLFYTHLYSLSRHDLKRQAGQFHQKNHFAIR
ncbi:B12-binding domain-containing radical SAM protein [Pelodictyon luteolum]|uniref:Elongator protein 3/MiaB/NifB n=1 Tax=Chlorobium luteolum (strain DSM 273 / BCRC 81028 / 2530) TaxID=319225 RepID=Q3B6I7_CHLL3|nr:radical SAM protein [Pelodictyon luteolum]ABB23044.1 Elongator protein 3/MiaB/NifB [Pelodictyon luteolum DSM 273]